MILKNLKIAISVILLSIPSLLIIVLVEIMRVEINIMNPLSQGHILVLWNGLELIPAFVFAYISDRNHRKKVLLWSLVLAFFGVVIFNFFGPKL